VSFALDQLARLNSGFGKSPIAGHLDLERVGVSGVSFGGMVGAQACLQDARLKACLVMDAAMPASVVTQGLRIPAMWITRPTATMRLERARAGGWTEKDIAQTQTTMRTVYERLPGDGFFVQVPGMFHVDLTDVALFSPLFSRAGFSGPIGAQRAHEIINAYALAFFDKTLKGRAPALLEGSSRRYPDVRLEARRAPYFRITMRRAPMNLPSTENRAK
jgi:predicted dienelactone hydrolase